MGAQERLYTNAEFWEIVQRPENEARRFELVNGVVFVSPHGIEGPPY